MFFVRGMDWGWETKSVNVTDGEGHEITKLRNCYQDVQKSKHSGQEGKNRVLVRDANSARESRPACQGQGKKEIPIIPGHLALGINDYS